MNSSNDLAIAIGAIVTIIGGFGAIAKLMLNQATKEREADRQERIHLSEAINKMAENSTKVAEVTEIGMKKVAEATDRTANEAKDRNGHLAELIVQQGNLIQGIADSATENIINGITSQHIEQMTVEHQVIKEPVIDRRKK